MVSVYEPRVGLLTFAAFHKTMKDHIRWVRMYTLNQTPPAELNVPEAWLRQNPIVDSYINNPYDATYKGFEVDWQTNLWYLPSVLKGVVLNVNYTRIFSETKYQSFERERVCVNCPSPRPRYDFVVHELVREGRMLDQPAHIANVTLGYDFRGFSARISYLLQTDRTSSVHSTVPVLDTFTGMYRRYDLSIRQKLRYGVELYTNFNNLTNTTDRSFQQSPVSGSPTYIEYYGFTMDVGARYRF
jgi:outer membrane receptor protein involved in Fe transport